MRKGFTFIIFLTLFISSLTLASDESIFRIQGIVMDLDLKKNILIVNERTLFWDQNTIFYNEKGSRVTLDIIKTRTWVYIEGIRDNLKKRVVAEKIYVIPKYIHEKEKHLYPFIQ